MSGAAVGNVTFSADRGNKDENDPAEIAKKSLTWFKATRTDYLYYYYYYYYPVKKLSVKLKKNVNLYCRHNFFDPPVEEKIQEKKDISAIFRPMTPGISQL